MTKCVSPLVGAMCLTILLAVTLPGYGQSSAERQRLDPIFARLPELNLPAK